MYISKHAFLIYKYDVGGVEKYDRVVKYYSWIDTMCEFFRRSSKPAKIC